MKRLALLIVLVISCTACVFGQGQNFPGGGSGGCGTAIVKTADYTATAADAGKTIVQNGGSFVTLPNPPPGAAWSICVEDINSITVAIDPNGRTLDGVAATITLAQGQGALVTTNGSNYFTVRGLSGIGLAPQYSAAYYSGAGSGVVINGSTAPTTPDGVSFPLTSTPAGGVSVAPAWSWPGVPIRAASGTTDTILATDRSNLVTESNVAAIAVTLPSAASTNFLNNFNHAIFNINSGLVTVTPTTSTINGNATQIVPNHWASFIYSDNTNYRAGTFADIAAYPNCVDSGGNHINFTSATGAFSCGTSSGGSGTVTTTGSPASSYCAYFSGATSIIGTANCILDSSGNLFAGGYTSVAGNFLVGGNSGGSASTVLISNGGVIDVGSGGVIKMSTTSNVFAGTLKSLIVNTAPTISSGFGTGASVTANNGTAAFRIGVGTSNTGNGVIGLPTANTGWNCYATDITTKSTSVAETLQTGSTTTTATLQNYSNIIGTGAWVDNDVLAVSCFGY